MDLLLNYQGQQRFLEGGEWLWGLSYSIYIWSDTIVAAAAVELGTRNNRIRYRDRLLSFEQWEARLGVLFRSLDLFVDKKF